MGFLELISSIWSKPGISEFASAALGGSMTILAQWVALRHDRAKEKSQDLERRRAIAWQVFFKIHHIFEVMTHIRNDVESDAAKAKSADLELWQVYQAPVHDARALNWEPEELLIFIDSKNLNLMQSYQEAANWLSNMIQSTRTYREMRVEFLSTMPASVEGDTGTIEVSNEDLPKIMPRIAHLRSLSQSILIVVRSQQLDVRSLLEGYVAIMKPIAGSAPVMELPESDSAQV